MSITRELIVQRGFFLFCGGCEVSLLACLRAGSRAGSSYGRLVAGMAYRTERQTDCHAMPCYAMPCYSLLVACCCMIRSSHYSSKGGFAVTTECGIVGKIPLEEGRGRRKEKKKEEICSHYLNSPLALGMVRLGTCCCHGDHRSLVSFLLFLFLSFFTFFTFY